MNELEGNSKILFDLFKEIEAALYKLTGLSRGNFPEVIQKACEKAPHIKKYAGELDDLSTIRNIICHKKREDLIDIPQKTVEKAKIILNEIKNPPTVLKKFGGNVYTCQITENLIKVLKITTDKIYTHVPVYSGEKFLGVLSESSVVNGLVRLINSLNLKEAKLEDIKEFIINPPNDCFKFVSEDTNAYTVKEWFLENIKDNKRLGAVFITKTGSKDEPLKGIITAWDLPELD